MLSNNIKGPVPADGWPEPRLRALQVEELYRFAGTAAGFSYFGALLTLGVLIDTGDIARGSIWFVWATAVTMFRFATLVAYRRRDPDSDPEPWGRLVIAANLLAGIQWGVLGTLLYPASSGYAQIFVVMVITCFVGGSLTAYGAVRGAHEALAIPATLPTAINLFFVQDGAHWFAGLTALFFCFAITYYAQKLNRHIVGSFRLQLECDAAGIIITCNRATERLLGLRYEDIVGRAFASFLSGPYAAGKALAGAREPVNVEDEVRDREGMLHVCTASFTPLPGREGIKPGFALILSGATLAAEVK